MSVTVEVEVDEREIINALVNDPDLITQALTILEKQQGGIVFQAALHALQISEGEETIMEAQAWAAAFRQMDIFDQQRALGELLRENPGNELLVGLKP